MPEGKLLGRVILTCPKKEELLELPSDAPVIDLLAKAQDLLGRGRFNDRTGHIVTSKHSTLDGGYYTWTQEGASDPDYLYVCQKGARRWPDIHGPADYVVSNTKGDYSYADLAGMAGYDRWMLPKCIILGDPEIMRIYPRKDTGTVYINRSELGDWGTKGKPIPLEGLGWWGTIKEFFAPPSIPLQPWLWIYREDALRKGVKRTHDPEQ